MLARNRNGNEDDFTLTEKNMKSSGLCKQNNISVIDYCPIAFSVDRSGSAPVQDLKEASRSILHEAALATFTHFIRHYRPVFISGREQQKELLSTKTFDAAGLDKQVSVPYNVSVGYEDQANDLTSRVASVQVFFAAPKAPAASTSIRRWTPIVPVWHFSFSSSLFAGRDARIEQDVCLQFARALLHDPYNIEVLKHAMYSGVPVVRDDLVLPVLNASSSGQSTTQAFVDKCRHFAEAELVSSRPLPDDTLSLLDPGVCEDLDTIIE